MNEIAARGDGPHDGRRDQHAAGVAPVRVWDLPTRVFHWLLVPTVVALVITAHVGGQAMVWHMRLGLFAMALLLFRLVWGVVGGRWSRFANFVYAPATILRYLRGGSRADEHHEVGHNPLGSLSVLAMLVLLCVQVASGLVADDEIAYVGPLNKFVSSAAASKASGWHADIGQWILIALVTAHVAAIIWYWCAKKLNLVTPMLAGDKPLPAGVPPSADGVAQRVLALAVAAGAAAVVAYVVQLGG